VVVGIAPALQRAREQERTKALHHAGKDELPALPPFDKPKIN